MRNLINIVESAVAPAQLLVDRLSGEEPGAFADLEATDANVVWIAWLERTSGKPGAGRALMKMITKEADELGVVLELRVDREEERLVTYYERFGFTVTEFVDESHQGYSMRRDPVQHLAEESSQDFELDVPTMLLAKVWNPLKNSPWLERNAGVNRDDIKSALTSHRLSNHRYDDTLNGKFKNVKDYYVARDNYDHSGRIAHLVRHPSKEAIHVIENGRGGWEIYDGFHRLAAAIYSQAPTVRVHVGGNTEDFMNWLSFAE